jgi:NTE family protein
MTLNLTTEIAEYGQTVLVLQGGGALGAYQAGVFEALSEAGITPDWVIGTSIGAINAALIAGNAPKDRMEALDTFWRRVQQHNPFALPFPSFVGPARTMNAIFNGIPNFFKPNPFAFLGAQVPLGADEAGYYSTEPLRETLEELVNFDLINDGEMRMTVGAVNVQTSEMRYFDTRDTRLDVRHVMASGALPPAFPAVRIDGQLYWDGGIVSNTPVEAVFDDHPRNNAMVFAVHLWNPHGPEPGSIWEVANRQKDIQYSSRAATHIKRQRQLHKLRHVITKLASLVPEDAATEEEAKELADYGCVTKMHVVRLLAPQLAYEDHTKDVDFTADGIRERREAGYAHTMATLESAPWRAEADPLEGFILHEAMGGKVVETLAAAD